MPINADTPVSNMSHSMNNSCGLILDMRRHDDILVSVNCAVYNHAPYLRQCLDGFIMQKTDFCFEVIVHDDVSTDGSVEIIKEYADKYPDIIKPIYEIENQYSKHDGSVRRIMLNASSGKYIAMCEGDDYWIDPCKLQKQVDFMESHPDYGLCHTMFQSEPIRRITTQIPQNEQDNYLVDLVQGRYRIGTLTVLYRKDTYNLLPFLWRNRKFLMGDYPQWIEFASISKIKYIPDCTGVYRVTSNSASHSTDIEKEICFILSGYQCACYYNDALKLNLRLDKRRIYNPILKVAMMHRTTEVADMYFKKAMMERALSLKGFIFFCATHCSGLYKLIDRLYRRL